MEREDEKYLSLSWPLISTSCETGIHVGDYAKKCETNGSIIRTRLIVLDDEEVKKQFSLEVPQIAVSILQTLIQVISPTFVRHDFGEFFFSAACMANFFVSTTLFSLLVSLINTTLSMY